MGWRWGRVLQAGGHAHVAEGLGGNGAQEMGVCGRAGGGGVDIRFPGTSSPWGRVSSYPPPPEPSLGAALPPISRGRRLGSPIPLQAWAGRPDPVQGVDSLSPHLSRLLPRAGPGPAPWGGPISQGSPLSPSQACSSSGLQEGVSRDPQHSPMVGGGPPPSGSPSTRLPGARPQPEGGRPQLPLFPRRHSRDVSGKINRTLDPSLGRGETAACHPSALGHLGAAAPLSTPQGAVGPASDEAYTQAASPSRPLTAEGCVHDGAGGQAGGITGRDTCSEAGRLPTRPRGNNS